jgi:hypothetical protein
MSRACSTYGMRNAYNTLVRKPDRKKAHGRRRRKFEDIIRQDLREIW